MSFAIFQRFLFLSNLTMKGQLQMNTTATSPTLIHLQDAVTTAAETLRAAQEVYQRASAALRMAEHQSLLTSLETAHLLSLRSAKRDPSNRAHHLAEAQKHANALAVYADYPLATMTLVDTMGVLRGEA